MHNFQGGYEFQELQRHISQMKNRRNQIRERTCPKCFFPFLVYYFSLSISILYLSCFKILHFYFIICPKQAERSYKTICGCAGCVFSLILQVLRLPLLLVSAVLMAKIMRLPIFLLNNGNLGLETLLLCSTVIKHNHYVTVPTNDSSATFLVAIVKKIMLYHENLT